MPYNEHETIERISRRFSRQFQAPEIGIGDDCSVILFDDTFYEIVTTDLLIEGVHFLKERITPKDLAYKALAVNLSDIAAMGGFPENAYLSLAVPILENKNFIDDLFEEVMSFCNQYNFRLAGGDTNRSLNDLVINVTLQGKVEKDRIKLRSGAQTGDIVCTTGKIGDSGVGLGIVLNHWKTENDPYFLEIHHRPRPHLEEARFLSKFSSVHAMLDVSDGIASDICHISAKSKKRCIIEADNLPYSGEFIRFHRSHEKPCHHTALSSGEDYCLLLSIGREDFHSVSSEFRNRFGHPLYKIGRIEAGEGVAILKDGTPIRNAHGFDHFRGQL